MGHKTVIYLQAAKKYRSCKNFFMHERCVRVEMACCYFRASTTTEQVGIITVTVPSFSIAPLKACG